MSHDPNDPLAPFRRSQQPQQQDDKTKERAKKLEELAPRMYRTLLLCEDVLSELGRLDDGTPSISALIDIRAIQREAGNLSEEQVIKLMQGSQALACAVHQEHRQLATEVEAAVAPKLLEENGQLKTSNAEILEALQDALDQMSNYDELVEQSTADDSPEFYEKWSQTLDKAREAIAKATPEQSPARELSAPEPEL